MKARDLIRYHLDRCSKGMKTNLATLSVIREAVENDDLWEEKAIQQTTAPSSQEQEGPGGEESYISALDDLLGLIPDFESE